jgi:hypothetical protein
MGNDDQLQSARQPAQGVGGEMFNSTFYPTPPSLVSKMVCRIKGQPRRILEPSAGKGDLIDGLLNRFSQYAKPEVFAIELDETLQATLRGKKIRVIDSNFLSFAGADKFDAIIMNPPFDDGDKHLHKALDILYRGQIICLLNAETLRNPHSDSRKLLARRLSEAGAQIEYISNAFLTAERRTAVEVALVDITIDRKVEDDLFSGCDDHGARSYDTVQEKHEISTGKSVPELVADYNDRIRVGTEVIATYYRHHGKVGKYLGLNTEAKDRVFEAKDLTAMMQAAINGLLRSARVDFWRRTLDLKEVKSRLTAKKREEFEHALTDRCHMDFTENNIRQFVLNLIGSYEKTLTDAVLDLFDMFTVRHTWHEDNKHEKNIHYFNGWKTNNAFKVAKRVVIPVRGRSYGSAFRGWKGWDLDCGAAEVIGDIDKVVAYFDGMNECVSLVDAIKAAFAVGENSGESTHFRFICYQKGTMHLTFKNHGILRRFNVVACRGKGWLPQDYGAKPYAELSYEEKRAAEAFDGEKVYKQNTGKALFSQNKLMIAA